MKWMILHPHSHQRNLTDTQITLEKYEAFFPGGNESGLKANPSKLHFGFSLHAYLRLKVVLKLWVPKIENTAYNIYCQISQKGNLSCQFNLPI